MKKTGVASMILAILVVLPMLSLAQSSSESPGQIAYIGGDNNVYTFVPGNAAPTALTNDASVTATAASIYQWPTWSPDGQLAYFRASLDASGGASTEVLIASDGQTPGVSAFVAQDQSFTYANWSPKACGADCHDLAVLLSGATSLSVEWLRWQNGVATPTNVGSGAPFYYNWSPDGARMIWQRDNQKFEIYDTASSQVAGTLTETPGAMFTPAWSPVDDRLLLGVKNQDNTDLDIEAGGQVTTLVSGQANPIWFLWSLDGKQVAYIDRQGPLIVLDSASGHEVTRSPVGGVLAFFWSPDAQHIAYITQGTAPGSFNGTNAKRAAPGSAPFASPALQSSGGLSWSVLDVASGANRRYGAFQPTESQVYLLNYFDQFAVSHHVWSPDSRQIVYSEVTSDQRSVISLLDTTQDVSVPLVIANGTIGIWSFR